MKKRLALFILMIASIIFLVVGCSSTNSNTPAPVEQEKQEDINSQEDTITPEEVETLETEVVDHLGRIVKLTKPVEKIVSGYYISTSAVVALGLEDKLVGIEAKAKSRPIYSLAAPRLLELPNVGTAKEFDLEGCIALEPDLVILPVKLKDQIKTLEDLGITVIGVNPESQELLEEMIAMIAILTETDKDRELLSYYEAKEKQLKDIIKDETEKPRVYLAGNNSLLSTATSKMYQDTLIQAAGGINVAGDIEDSYWADISYEQLVQYNPEYIVIVPDAQYTKEDLINDSNLAGILAIENNQVYQMPSQFEAWDSPVPSSILGKLWLTSILNPEEYPNKEFTGEVSQFYKEFYDFEANLEELMAQ